jgi:hypothetical protein
MTSKRNEAREGPTLRDHLAEITGEEDIKTIFYAELFLPKKQTVGTFPSVLEMHISMLK